MWLKELRLLYIIQFWNLKLLKLSTMTQFNQQTEFKQLCKILANVLHNDFRGRSVVQANWGIKKVRKELDFVLDMAINVDKHIEWSEDYQDDVNVYSWSVLDLAGKDVRMCQTIHEFVESRVRISEQFDWIKLCA